MLYILSLLFLTEILNVKIDSTLAYVKSCYEEIRQKQTKLMSLFLFEGQKRIKMAFNQGKGRVYRLISW